MGNTFLGLATLAVGALAVYLVLAPPGVLDPASQQVAPAIPVGTETAPAPGAPVPPQVEPAEVPGQLSLGPACGAVSPLLNLADEVRSTAIDNSDALNTEMISDLTRDLQSVSDISPDELDALIDPLTTVLVELNNAILAGEENPEIDSEVAEGTTESIRVLCK